MIYHRTVMISNLNIILNVPLIIYVFPDLMIFMGNPEKTISKLINVVFAILAEHSVVLNTFPNFWHCIPITVTP